MDSSLVKTMINNYFSKIRAVVQYFIVLFYNTNLQNMVMVVENWGYSTINIQKWYNNFKNHVRSKNL